MKKILTLMTIAFMISAISFNVFAVETDAQPGQNAKIEQSSGQIAEHHRHHKTGEKDPLKRLEKKKEFIEKEYKEGKITKEKADEMIGRIDKRIAQIKEFNNLSLPKKKELLFSKAKAHIERQIKDGKITKEEGDQLLKEYNKTLENWDGQGFPGFVKKNGNSVKHKE